jgi:excisionase family DNA binding protein
MTEGIRLYTVDDVADMLKLTRRTLYSYIKAGRLDAVKVGRYWRIRAETLENFLR